MSEKLDDGYGGTLARKCNEGLAREGHSELVGPPGSAVACKVNEVIAEMNRHIEALERIGTCGVTGSILHARSEHARLIEMLHAKPQNAEAHP